MRYRLKNFFVNFFGKKFESGTTDKKTSIKTHAEGYKVLKKFNNSKRKRNVKKWR